MSTKTKMSKSDTKVKSRTPLEMEIGFSKEQKGVLEKMMKDKISECVDNIMNSDSEGDDFEGDRDSFNNLFEKLFTFKSLKEETNVKEKKTVKSKKIVKDPNMPKKFKTAYFMWLWNDDINIGMSKIKKDFPELIHKQALSKAGQIWNEMNELQKQPFTDLSLKDKARYELEMLDYNPPSSADADEEIEVVELKKKGKKKKSLTKDVDEEIEVVELKKKGKKKKSLTKDVDEEIEVVELKKKGKKKSLTKDVDEEIEVVELKKKGKKKSLTKDVDEVDTDEVDTDEVDTDEVVVDEVDVDEVDTDEEIEVKEDLEGFERKDNLFLYGYTKKTGSTKFNTLTEAASALEEDEEATGIVKDSQKLYTVRKGKVYKDTPEAKQPEICWKKL